MTGAAIFPIPGWFVAVAIVLVLVSLFEPRLVRALRRRRKRRR